jgi:hypothetical protein
MLYKYRFLWIIWSSSSTGANLSYRRSNSLHFIAIAVSQKRNKQNFSSNFISLNIIFRREFFVKFCLILLQNPHLQLFFSALQLHWWVHNRLRLDRSMALYIYRENKIQLVDLSIQAQKEKCLFNYSTYTLFYKDLFLTIINCYNQDFVKSAIFQRNVHVS